MTDAERDKLLIENSAKLDSLHRQLLGNGQPGCIDKIETRVGDLEKNVERARGVLWVLGIIWTFIVGGLEFLFHRK